MIFILKNGYHKSLIKEGPFENSNTKSSYPPQRKTYKDNHYSDRKHQSDLHKHAHNHESSKKKRNLSSKIY